MTEHNNGRSVSQAGLVIFDCDGVLVDSEVIAVEVDSRMLTAAGFPMTVDEVAETCVGLSYNDMAAMLEQRFGKPVPSELSQEIQRTTLSEFPNRLKPVSGVARMLAGLDRQRCVASSSDPNRLDLSLGITDLKPFFSPDRIFSATMVDNGKPAPDLFLHAAAQVGVDPDQCVVVEDSPHGVTAGVAAGMEVIGFVGGSHARPSLTDRLNDAGASTVVTSHEAVARLLAARP